HFKLKHSYGTLICNRCRSDLGPFINNEKQELHEARFKWILDIEMSDESDNENSNAGSNFIPSQSSTGSDQSDIKKQQRMALNKFLELCNIRKQVRVTKSYTNLTEQSKRNFLSTTRIIIKSIVGFVALNDTNIVINELKQNIEESKEEENELDDQSNNESNVSHRFEILRYPCGTDRHTRIDGEIWFIAGEGDAILNARRSSI
ncbi:unnamed protein product, partial [Didymodactylos carnosus]